MTHSHPRIWWDGTDFIYYKPGPLLGQDGHEPGPELFRMRGDEQEHLLTHPDDRPEHYVPPVELVATNTMTSRLRLRVRDLAQRLARGEGHLPENMPIPEYQGQRNACADVAIELMRILGEPPDPTIQRR